MSLLRKKSWWKHVTESRITLIILILLCIAISFEVYDRYTVEREVASRRHSKEADLSKLSERKEDLVERINYLKGEQGIESEIRRHFDVVKEGEKVVILTGESESNSQVANVSNAVIVEEEKGWFGTFLSKIFPW